MNRILAGVPELLAQADQNLAAQTAEHLGMLAYVVLGLYLLVLLVLGIAGWRRSQGGEEDYYLAGRSQGWVVSSVTIMATFFSSFALLGAPGMVYRDGVVFALYSLNVPVGGLIVAMLGARVSEIGRRHAFVTPGDMVSAYYESRVALRLLVALAGFLYAVPYVVMQIQAGGLVAEQLFGGGTFTVGASVLAGITTVYIMVGGMRSVAWTDVLQGLLLISGMLVGGLAMFLLFDGPREFGHRVVTELPASSLTAPGNSGRWHWPMLFTACVLTSVGSMIQPAQWMRYYAARDVQTLRRGGVIFATVLTACYLGGVMLIGLAGQVLYPLTFRHSVPLPEGLVIEATETLPAHLARHLRVLPAEGTRPRRLAWEWSGRDTAPLTPEAERQLQAWEDAAEFQNAVRELAERTRAAPAEILPHSAVDPRADGQDFDSILIVVLRRQLPAVLGGFGALFATLMIVAIMAASMSTADSNLHALSAVVTRDVYDQFLRPRAGQTERVWLGRAVILGTTVLALAIVVAGRQGTTQWDFLSMIVRLGLVAIAFSAQLLPILLDMLYVQRGTRAGAAWGLACGLLTTLIFSPLWAACCQMTGDPAVLMAVQQAADRVREVVQVDSSAYGLAVNVLVFVAVSLVTRPVPAERRAAFSND